jgi:hypothetical protein
VLIPEVRASSTRFRTVVINVIGSNGLRAPDPVLRPYPLREFDKFRYDIKYEGQDGDVDMGVHELRYPSLRLAYAIAAGRCHLPRHSWAVSAATIECLRRIVVETGAGGPDKRCNSASGIAARNRWALGSGIALSSVPRSETASGCTRLAG